MITALGIEEAERIRDMGDGAGASYSDVLAALIRIGFAHTDELPEHLQLKEELPLSETA